MLQVVDSARAPVAGVEVMLDSEDHCRQIGPSDAAGGVPTFTARPDDEIKLRRDGYRDVKLVVRSREIEIYRSPEPTTNPMANIAASILSDLTTDDKVSIEKGRPIVIELKNGKGRTELLRDASAEIFTRMIAGKLSRDMVHSCIQLYPWKVQFPYVESERYEATFSFP